MNDSKNTDKPKFWGRRQGRPLRKKRSQALDKGLELFGIDETLITDHHHSLSIDQIFAGSSSEQESWLEIGFGSGEHILYQASHHPDVRMIGCEPFVNGISMLFKEMEEYSDPVDNIRVWPEDARLLMKALEADTIDRCFILFPDPWPKTRHHKRRFIQKETLDQLARILKPGARLELATDHPGLADWMLNHILAHDRFEWMAEKRLDWRTPPQEWIQTRYQKKAKAGTDNWFIHARKV